MRQRSRSDARQSPTRPDSTTYLKFLKPGALAQLRNSRLTSRSHHRPIVSLPSPPPSPASPAPPGPHSLLLFGGAGLLPSSLSYGPRFPQRKKLVAAKVSMFLRPPPSPVADSPDLIIGVLSGGGSTDVGVAAH